MTPGVLGTSHTIANSSILGERQTIRGLPSKCYTSPDLYEVERRAIFSRKWQILTHSSRFPGVGDYLKYDIAGFEILLVKNRDNEINGFHNICRHRAFPVVTEDKGTARILSCKYHGWSYGLNGKLAKAPSYQDIPGFDKSRNSLFPIHVHIDQRGFAWVNLDGKATPEIEWEDDFSGTDESSSIDYSEYEFDHHREMSGSWNWKILADNYNGCYHCPTAQPSTSEPTSEQLDRCSIIRNSSSSSLTQAYHFPNASTTTTPKFFYIRRFIPQGPSASTIRYEVFRHRSATDEDLAPIQEIYKRLENEDKALFDKAQKNVNRDISPSGELRQQRTEAALWFQKLTKDEIMEWQRREKVLGREIWPARPPAAGLEGKGTNDDEEFCSGLACESGVKEGLAW